MQVKNWASLGKGKSMIWLCLGGRSVLCRTLLWLLGVTARSAVREQRGRRAPIRDRQAPLGLGGRYYTRVVTVTGWVALTRRGRSSMVEPQPSKLVMRVRFPSPALIVPVQVRGSFISLPVR